MNIVVFAFGVLVFLITVYGTVVIGGLLLTDRQLEEQPDLAPDVAIDPDDNVAVRARQLVSAEY